MAIRLDRTPARPGVVPADVAEAVIRARSRLGALAAPLVWYDDIPSTNSEALAMAETGAPEGWTVGAERQSERLARAGADIILLDNLSLEEVHEAVARCHGRARTEISGGVTLDRLPGLAATGATSVSAGALTHSAPAADLSFEIEPL